MSERLKLKRGLSDVSPLFMKKNEASIRARIVAPDVTEPAPRLESEIFFIWCVDDESDSHFLNNFFASKMVSSNRPALLITVQDHESIVTKPESWNKSLRRVRLSAEKLKEAFAGTNGVGDFSEEPLPAQIFLEMKMELLLRNPELIRTLDHLVLFLKPQVDSVTEAYRRLKRLSSLNLKAETAVVFDADDAGKLPARVYELFSDFVSRKLSLSSGYLGTLHLSRGGAGLSQNILWDTWNSLRLNGPASIEKAHFLKWIDQMHIGETQA